jgi:hypothetical protein
MAPRAVVTEARTLSSWLIRRIIRFLDYAPPFHRPSQYTNTSPSWERILCSPVSLSTKRWSSYVWFWDTSKVTQTHPPLHGFAGSKSTLTARYSRPYFPFSLLPMLAIPFGIGLISGSPSTHLPYTPISLSNITSPPPPFTHFVCILCLGVLRYMNEPLRGLDLELCF